MIAAVVIGGILLLQQQKLRQAQLTKNQTQAASYGGAATSVINALGNLFKGLGGSSGTSTPTNPANTGYNPSASQAGASASAAQTSDTGNTDFPYFGAPPSTATNDGVAYNPPNASPYDAMSYA